MSDRIAGRVDQSIDTRATTLMVRASDLEIEGRDGIVGSRDVGGEVGLGDVFRKSLTPICDTSEPGGCLKNRIK